MPRQPKYIGTCAACGRKLLNTEFTVTVCGEMYHYWGNCKLYPIAALRSNRMGKFLSWSVNRVTSTCDVCGNVLHSLDQGLLAYCRQGHVQPHYAHGQQHWLGVIYLNKLKRTQEQLDLFDFVWIPKYPGGA